ncbi:MAG: PIN domain-containing protein, partial [Kiritimatiellia bacterium]|nr:PIN domain-containing protein [Kiritimatiellia bacterium]
MKKTYILDTNVLLHDPNAILHFEDNTVVLPIAVIEEIDSFKRDVSELGRNARTVARALDELRSRGKLSEGVALDNGGRLRIALADGELPRHAGPGAADYEILKLARNLSRNPEADPCVVVSKDINLRIKADGIGISAQDYETDRVDINELYLGYDEMEISPEMMSEFAEKGRIPYEGSPRNPNEYLLLKNTAEPQHTLLGRIDPEGRAIIALLAAPRE